MIKNTVAPPPPLFYNAMPSAMKKRPYKSCGPLVGRQFSSNLISNASEIWPDKRSGQGQIEANVCSKHIPFFPTLFWIFYMFLSLTSC